MRAFVTFFLALFLGFFSTAEARAAHTKATLALSADTARPGETILAGVQLRMDPGWHTYWRNPGGPGIPTSIEWQLPAGVTAGNILWPVPDKFTGDDSPSYIYTNETVLLVPLTIASNAPAGPLELKGKVSWLECNQACVPGGNDVQATLNVGPESQPSFDAALFDAWQKQLPVAKPGLAATAHWESTTGTNSRTLVLEWPAPAAGKQPDFFPFESDKFEFLARTELLPAADGKVRLRKEIKKLEGDWPDKVSGLLVHPAENVQMAYEVTISISSSALPAAVMTASNPGTDAAPNLPKRSLARMLAFAFLGGMILNVMPCVLPVIALKILGFVNQSKAEPRRVRRLGLVYAAGVLVSFLALAALVIGVQMAGHKAGWGLQFGNPQFLVVMTVLVTLVALNLFGLFEFNLGGRVMGAAGELSSREGAAGAFFNGVLATILATPCTAPFLSVAIGFAFSQSYPVIVLIFLTVGLGLAFPYVLLSWHPDLLKVLPKPGVWMEKFKIAMGFPMLATAVWLFSLTLTHYGKRVLWLALFLVMVGFAAWIFGEFVQRGRRHKLLAAAISLAVLLGGYTFAIERHLHWRAPMSDLADAAPSGTNPNGIRWQPWSPQAVMEARAAGHPVLVDFTADWCQICQWNKTYSIEVAPVEKKLKEIHAVTLVADYTKLPPAITAELQRFGRAGVPLVLIYPPNPNAPPEVLPDGYLTPGIVLNALDKAARNASTPGISTANR